MNVVVKYGQFIPALALSIGTGCAAESSNSSYNEESINVDGALESREPDSSHSPNLPEGENVSSSQQSLIAPSTLIKQIAFRVFTGDDDKRSDSRVTFRLSFRDGTATQYVSAAGTTTRWANGTWSPYTYFSFPTKQSGNIYQMGITWSQGGAGGWGADNWNVDGYEMWALDVNNNWTLHRSFTSYPENRPSWRFTGDFTSLSIMW